MSPLADSLDALAREVDFSGVISVRNGTEIAFERAYGLANRADDVPNTPGTQFGLASGTNGSGPRSATVISDTAAGAWPIVRHLEDLLNL